MIEPLVWLFPFVAGAAVWLFVWICAGGTPPTMRKEPHDTAMRHALHVLAFRRRLLEETEANGLRISELPLREAERRYIFSALEYANGNRTKAAKLLEIRVRALQYKLKAYAQAR